MEKLITIKDLYYEIPHTGTILENINLEIAPGEFIGVLGHNGAGKTTLLDLMMGFRNTKRGEIRVLGEDPNQGDRKKKEKIIFLSHESFVKGALMVAEFLDFFAEFYPDYSSEKEKTLLETFKLDRNASIGSLSLGQQKKLHFVAGLSSMPKLIIVDEITAVFDPQTRELFFHFLKKERDEQGATIVLATNIADDLIGIVDKVLFIKNKTAQFHSVRELPVLYGTGEAS